MPVATCVITWSAYGTSSSGYPPSPVLVNVFQAFAAIARASITWRETEPKDMPPPYRGIGISIRAPVPRRFSGSAVDTSVRDAGSNLRREAGKSKSRRSNPPPARPTRYSRPRSGGRPVSAIAHVDMISSFVHRGFPRISASGFRSIAIASTGQCFTQ